MSGYKRGDHFTRKAKSQGYAARSVYKLEEMDRRYKLLRPGQRAVDLGCYPGSWSRYLSQRIGVHGTLVGVDIEETQGIPGHFITRSVFEVTSDEILTALGGPADIVVSDMAPRTTGDTFGDHVRQIALAECALYLASQVLGPKGAFVVKVFDGADAQEYTKKVREVFKSVKRLKPEATRRKSKEFFLIGTGLKHTAQQGEQEQA